jgi:hypothetical protein
MGSRAARLSSDAHGNVASARVDIRPLPPLTLDELRPDVGGLPVSGGGMASQFGGVGRPSNDEIERQRAEFRALVKAGLPWLDAARQAGCKLERALVEAEAIARSLLGKAA